MDILTASKHNIKRAHKIIKLINIEEILKDFEVNLVGSLKTELLMDRLDIDFHIYSKTFSIEKSLQAITDIAKNERVIELIYRNLIDEDDRCLEYHLTYLDESNDKWHIDIIHILNDSKYKYKFERVAEKINKVMTEEIRKTILEIKHEALKRGLSIKGIEVYKAVIEDKIKNIDDFLIWLKKEEKQNIMLWEPNI